MLNYPGVKNVAFCGDIHGEFKKLVHKCCVLYGMHDTLIVVSGDCGFGFESSGYYENVYNRCRNLLHQSNNWIVFVRGNHDNPAYFDGKQVNYQRWKAVPDYTVIEACGHTILCVGGATSVDRMIRKNDWRFVVSPKSIYTPNIYWPNEQPYYDEKKLSEIDKGCAIDTVVTHTAPSFCELNSLTGIQEWADMDKRLIDDVKNERKVMDHIHAFLYSRNHPVVKWYYGHFHQSWHKTMDDVEYHLLDIMELRLMCDTTYTQQM